MSRRLEVMRARLEAAWHRLEPSIAALEVPASERDVMTLPVAGLRRRFEPLVAAFEPMLAPGEL